MFVNLQNKYSKLDQDICHLQNMLPTEQGFQTVERTIRQQAAKEQRRPFKEQRSRGGIRQEKIWPTLCPA
jgi:hypothetical protein